MDMNTFFRGFGFITPAPTAQEREAAMAAHPAGKGRVEAEAPTQGRHRQATGNPHKPESGRAPKHSAEFDWAAVTPINTGSTRHLDRVGSDWDK